MPNRTYIPTLVLQIHEAAKYMTRYNAIIRPAIATLDPEAVAAYDTLYTAALAFDALAKTLYPDLP